MDDKTKEMVTSVADALKPLTGLAERLFGGPFDQIGRIVENELRFRDQVRQLALFRKLKAAIDESGFDPRTIPDNIWVPALREALLQDDDTIQSKWANLLANAADPRKEKQVEPSFVVMLKELTSREVQFLDELIKAIDNAPDKSKGAAGEFLRDEILAVYQMANGLSADDTTDFTLSVQLLGRNGILTVESVPLPIDIGDNAYPPSSYGGTPVPINTRETIYFTQLGRRFVLACQTPSPV